MCEQRFFVSVNGESLVAFEKFCQSQGIKTERNMEAANSFESSLTAVTPIIVAFASYEVFSKCILAYRNTRPVEPSITTFTPDDGWKTIRGYSADDVIKILKETNDIRLEESAEPVTDEPKEMGFHTLINPPDNPDVG